MMRDIVKANAIQQMADFLMDFGFTPKEAWIESERFWNRHKGKLGNVV